MNLFFRKTTGLVLGGGGARGFFHMGVIKAIQELGIEISQISGTSIGAVIGAIYAANPGIDFEKVAREIDFLKLTQTLVLATQKKSNKIEAFLKNYIKVENFNELKIPLIFNATDINQKEEIVFSRGKIFPGLLASVSIPGVFPPIEINKKHLVDGGVVNNVPVSLLKPVSRYIVSDITGPIKVIDDKTSGLDVLYSSIALMQQNNSFEKMKHINKQKIVYLPLNDHKVFVLDFRKKNYQSLIDLGYQSMMTNKNFFN